MSLPYASPTCESYGRTDGRTNEESHSPTADISPDVTRTRTYGDIPIPTPGAAMTQPCIRRPGAVWTLCRCEPCRLSNNRLAKRYRSGHSMIQGREAAWARLTAWHRRGWSPKIVADITGLSDVAVRDCYRAIERGECIPVVQATVVRVLSATDQPRGKGWLPSTGSVRRLRALTLMGWSMAELAARYDADPSTLSTIRSGRLRSIRGDSAQLVSRAYDDLWNEPGPGRLAATRAQRRGWAPPLAWDDETIDDPTAEANIGERHTPTGGHGRLSADLVEDVAFLLSHDAAMTTTAAAARLGLHPESLKTALSRAGRTDLRNQLTRNAQEAAA